MPEPTHLYLKPKPPKDSKGPRLCIRDPRSRMKLPVYGAKVPNNRYWRARRADGDCVKTTAEAIATAKKAEAKKVADAAKDKTATPAKSTDDAKAQAATAYKPAKRGR